MTDEKRKFHRVHNKFNVRIAKEISNAVYKDLLLDQAQSINISGSGILINIKEFIAIHDKVRITFLQPNTFEFFEGSGSVIRAERKDDGSYEVGINFIDLSDQEKRRLDYYIKLASQTVI